ncbi:MAG: CvpA family protein [Rhodobacteraceae bacterium]|nr:CvpA family protein [Paracoccaceae bacterium]
MDGFTLFDAIVAVLVIISAILAYSRGFVREVMSIAGWIVAAIVGFIFAPRAEPLMRELPVVGRYLADSCELSIIAAFVAVFAVALVVMSIFTPLFSSLIQRSAIGGLDRGLGFLFGAARGVLLVVVALIVYDRVVVGESLAMIDDSRTAQIFANTQDQIDEQLPDDAPGWLVGRYEQLVGVCTG